MNVHYLVTHNSLFRLLYLSLLYQIPCLLLVQSALQSPAVKERDDSMTTLDTGIWQTHFLKQWS